jgi:serine/threonine protein kinase/Flp pilus assembly protein TadD
VAVKCPKCHFENPDDTLYCGKCATPLPAEEISAPTETLKTAKEELTTGSTFAGRYQIIEELGKGGMGKVYKVLDTEIKEKIALKLIKPEVAADKKTIERFRNELKFARKIRHQNVCQMYDLNKEAGAYYITMEYVTGEDLKGLIRRVKQIPIGTTISIAKQVCEGLTEAHRLGLIHRDLKSSNIMIDKEGNARIMDFGIARSIESKGITGAGMMIGTPEYMSPEQAEVKDVDQRSDIYSLGVILYEMATGRVPFEGETPLGIAMKHKSEIPKDPKEINAQISEDLSGLILKCLEKDKHKRYQSAGEVRSELENIEKGMPTTERIIPDRRPSTSKEITVTFGLKKLLIPALVAVVLIIIALTVWQPWSQKEAVPIPSGKPSIAVIPFIDLSPKKDQEYFCDGMTDEIIAKLSRFKGWRVIPRTSMMRYKNTNKDIKQIGQELDVTTILEGSIGKESDDIRVNAKLIRIEDSISLWSDTYEKKLESVFAIQSDIAEKIANALQGELSPEEKERLEKKPTENLEAYNLYLQGRYFWNKRTYENLKKAIKYFEQAIKKDQNYALAYAGLADTYVVLPSYSPVSPKIAFSMGKKAALKALEMDDTIAEAHASLAMVIIKNDYDWLAAERELKRAIELNPGLANAHHWYAFYLMWRGEHDGSIAEIKIAQECDPLSLIINANVGFMLYLARQYDQAIEKYRSALELDANFAELHEYLGKAYVQKGMYEEAIAKFQEAITLSGDDIENMAMLGHAYAASGRKDEALKVIGELKELSKRKHVSPYDMAVIYVALGEKNQAFAYLEKAYNERDDGVLYLKASPVWDSIRSDPRFKELLKKIGLE